MKKYKIADKRCNICGGLISWDDYPNPKLPIHVDNKGYKIGDGDCHYYLKEDYNHFSTQKFHRFGSNGKLNLFESYIPHITRFLIGKIDKKINVITYLIKIPDKTEKDELYRNINKITRLLFDNNEIISFFKIIPEISEEEKKKFVTINILNNLSINNEELQKIINTHLNSNLKIVNSSEEIINLEDNLDELKTFFDSIFYELRFKFKKDNIEPYVRYFYDITEEKILFYVDIDVGYPLESSKPISKDEIGKRVLGKSRFNINKKYILREITTTSISEHLNSEEYRNSFIPFIQNTFFKAGKPKKRKDGKNWTIYDLWTEINEIKLDRNDNIAIVSVGTDFRAKKFFFPKSRLFIPKPYIPEKTERANDIQKVKEELYKMLKQRQEILEKLKTSLKIILLEEVIPRYYDLMKFPFEIEFKNKIFNLQRKEDDKYYLNYIPQELLKSDYLPLAGKFEFAILSILPKNLTKKEQNYFESFEASLKEELINYNLASNVKIENPIKYTFNSESIINNERNVWADNFNKEIAPKLIRYNEEIKDSSKIVILLLGLKELHTASKIFKREMENYFYNLLKSKLSSLHFSVVQGIKYDKKSPKTKSQKATMFYRNCLQNIAANNPKSDIAKKIRKGLIFTKKRPFGTLEMEKIEESVDMIAGFDASKAEHAEFSTPRGATITMIDPYGRQIKTGYIENALTNAGVISEKAVRDIIIDTLNIQKNLLRESYESSNKNVKKNTLDYFIYKNPDIQKKILFVYDGKFYQKQISSFITIYRELKKKYSIMPEIYLFEILKSHPIRNYLYKDNKVENIPFGTLAILNEKEILLTSHILPNKKYMVNSCLYRFKMLLTNKEQTDVVYQITEKELLKVGIKLFQTSLFNTGKSGRPLKETKVIHESHKLSKEYSEKPDSIGILHYKD